MYLSQLFSLIILICLITDNSGLTDQNGPSAEALLNMIYQINSTLNKCTSDIQTLKSELTIKDQDIASLKEHLSDSKIKRAPANELPVAFYAKLDHNIDPVGTHQTLTYDHVITNLGNAYDPRHGHFIAPLKGVYHFSVTFMGSVNNYESVEIVKDGAVLAPIYSDGQHLFETGAGSVIVTLDAGQMVWVRYAGGAASHIHGGFNLFSGFLIQEIA